MEFRIRNRHGRGFLHDLGPDAGFPEHLRGQVIRIAFAVKDVFHAAVDEHFAALQAGVRRTVDIAPQNGDTVRRGLDDAVLPGVGAAADLMALSRGDMQFVPEAADIEAVAHAGGRAVVSGGQDALVLDEDAPDPAADAGGALADHIGDAHEIFRPGQALWHGNLRCGMESSGLRVREGRRAGQSRGASPFPAVCVIRFYATR